MQRVLQCWFMLYWYVLIVLSRVTRSTSSVPWMVALSGFLIGHSPNLEPSTSRTIMPPDHLISLVHALGARYTDGSWTHDVWTSVDIFWHICGQCLMISWSISHTPITLHIYTVVGFCNTCFQYPCHSKCKHSIPWQQEPIHQKELWTFSSSKFLLLFSWQAA